MRRSRSSRPRIALDKSTADMRIRGPLLQHFAKHDAIESVIYEEVF